MSAESPTPRRIRLCFFNTWANGLVDAADYIERLTTLDLRPWVAKPNDPSLLRKARLDCDWYGEIARCLVNVTRPGIEFLPATVTGPAGLMDLAKSAGACGEESWLIAMGQQPQALGFLAGRTLALLARTGVRNLYYSFDEASRKMPCFNDIAPFLDVLIHDESPLAEAGQTRLRVSCRTSHRSWVANLVPFSAPFNEDPETKILFLGSQIGLTPHRQRQIELLKKTFKDRFFASHDHTISVADRFSLNRFKVSLCPEGRHFISPAMGQTHTDRPFWSGCLGMVPVSENSKTGGRLEELHQAGLIVRYPHGDHQALVGACEVALGMGTNERRRIYEHFNRHETVGAVVADAIFAAGANPARSS